MRAIGFIVTLTLSLLAPWVQAADESLLQSNPKVEQDKVYVQLQVIDSFLELHSGPGRGYPIFHVIERGDTVKVITQRTNWFYVADHRDRKGWVKQENLARTLVPTGLPAALPDTQHGDFLAQQGRVGFSLGQQEQAETASIMAGYRLLSWLGAEAEYGQIFGKSIDGTSYGASLIFEPIKQWSFTPFISAGLGKQTWQQKSKQQVGTNESIDSDYEFIGAGVNYYIGFSFVVRAEYRQVTLSSSDNLNNNQRSATSGAWRIGFSSFF